MDDFSKVEVFIDRVLIFLISLALLSFVFLI